MAHNLDESTGKHAIAFGGGRNDIWHRYGQQHEEGGRVGGWRQIGGLDWTAVRCPALADLSALPAVPAQPWNGLSGALVKVEHDRYIVRSDNGHVLGHASDRYQPVQPTAVLDWFERYCAVDARFKLDVAGALKEGEIIWATATCQPNGHEITVAGDAHKARLLMTTTFDGTGSTINRATMTRVVCNNTLDAALADRQKSIVRTRHSTKFDPARVGAELATIAKGFTAYAAMGEAMAAHKMTTGEVGKLFRHVLEIPLDQPAQDTSTRKKNQYADLSHAFTISRSERGEALGVNTAWTALNAVTRYADHDRSVRGDGEAAERRFTSSVVECGGSGQALKARAGEDLVGCGVYWRGCRDMQTLLHLH